MNKELKTVLLTVLTLSVFVLALVELSGVSKTALINKFGGDDNNQQPKINIANLPKTKMLFEQPQFSFGTINEGDKVTHSYKFKNTGEHPLVISKAVAGCGCTVPSYPKAPILPGGEGEIVVTFDSHGKKGHQQKNVIVYSNAEQEATSIGFDADVKEQ